ncbi:MAG TPA: hypothetical protein VN743_03115 [Blastocatellia bacterium]|nr:hypothetical protein [Blastocatellia bacterium]
MKRIILGALLVFTLFSALPAQTPEVKSKPDAAKADGVALTAADTAKLQSAVEALNLAQARYQAALSEFLRAKAEVIGDHGLAPSKYDLSQDGKSIVKKPEK